MFRAHNNICAKLLRPQGRLFRPMSSAYRQPLCMDTRRFSASTNNNEVKEVKTNRFQEIFQKYGYVAIGTYLSVYVVTLSGVFVALDYDFLAASSLGFDPIATTKSACDKIEYFTGISSVPEFIRQNPRAGTFAIAWIMTKFTEPFRLGATFMIVPKLGQYVYDKKHHDH